MMRPVGRAEKFKNRRTAMTTIGQHSAGIQEEGTTKTPTARDERFGGAKGKATSRDERAKVNGVELGYRVFGEGPPLILLHGAYGSLEMFGPNVELLAAHHQVIGVDLQSHGRSPTSDRPMRY